MANEFKVKKGLIVDGSNTVLDIQGTQGQLFSVTDSLTGDLFSVSDVSGIPILNVNSSGISNFDGKVGIGTNVPATMFDVIGTDNGDTIRIANTGTYGGTISFNQGAANTNIGYVGSLRALEGNGSGDNGIGLYSRNRISFYTNSTTPDLTIADNGSATFAGNVTFNGPQTTFNPDGNSQAKILNVGTDAIALYASAGDGLYLGGGGTTNLYLDTGTSATFSGRVNAGESFGALKDGADTVADGPFFRLTNAAQTRQQLFQLDASNNIDYWYYDGSAWTQTISFLTDGGASFTGDVNTSGDVHIDEGSTSAFQTTNKLRFGNTSWNNNVGLESYWMVIGCNQNEGFKFRDSSSNMLLQLNGGNNSGGNGALSATFAGDITVTGGQVFLTASNYAIENVNNNYGVRNSSGNYGGNDGTNAYTTPQDFFHIPGTLRVGPKFATSDRDYIRLIPAGATSTIEMPNENAYIHNNAGNIVLRTGTSTDAVTVTGSDTTFAGNVALGGGTLQTYHSNVTSVLALDDQTSLFTRADQLFLANNCFYNSSDTGIAIEAGKTSLVQLDRDKIRFYFTASASAGGGVSFQEKFRLDDSGNATFAGNVIPSSNPGGELGTGAAQWSELNLSSSAGIIWGNGDASIVEGTTENYSLSFNTYDGSSNSRALYLQGNNNATFTGDVTIDSSSTAGSTVLDVQGTAGQLFSVTNSLTGDLFSVADVSGIPIFNVNSSGLSTFDGAVENNGITTYNTPAGGVAFNLDAAADNYGTFRLRTNGNVNKWDVGMKNDNDFYIYNQATSAQAFEIDTSNNIATFSATTKSTRFTSTTASGLHFSNYTGSQGWQIGSDSTAVGMYIYFENGTYAMKMTSAGDATFAGELYLPSYVRHVGDSDTYFGFSGANAWKVRTGGVDRLSVTGDVNVNSTTDLNINGTSRRLNFNAGTGTVRTTTANSLILATNSTTALTIASDQHSTFSGQVSVHHIDTTSTTANIFLGSVICKPSSNNLGFILRNSTNGIIGQLKKTSDTGSQLTCTTISATSNIYTSAGTIGNLNSSSDIGQQMEYGDANVATLRCDANRWRVYMGGAGNSQETLTVNESGDVGIKDPTPSYRLDVAGTIRATGDVIAYSDERVKENINTIDNSLEKVNKLRGVEFNKIGEDQKSIGVIAQEIEKILPEVVRTDDKGMKSVAYGNIVGVLIEAVKELTSEVEQLKKQINGSTK